MFINKENYCLSKGNRKACCYRANTKPEENAGEVCACARVLPAFLSPCRAQAELCRPLRAAFSARRGQLQHSSFVWPALLCALSSTPSVLGPAPIPHACLFWVLLTLFFPVCLIRWCPLFLLPEQSRSISTKSPHF